MMPDVNSQRLVERSADELATAAQQLANVAVELNALAKTLDAQPPEALLRKASQIQDESMRVVLAALAARSVGERLAVVAQVREARDD